MIPEAPPAVPGYRGRFAPSPTGPLHFGSLLAAVASYADARAHAGLWLLRIEDLDRPREVPGAAADIQRTLRAFGFDWDEPPLHQSQRTDAYGEALSRLLDLGLAYPCACSRAEIAQRARVGAEGPIYPGTCRNGIPSDRCPRSIRMLTDDHCLRFTDRVQGHREQRIEDEVGDFVLRRADGIHAYQLAVVVDDAWQRITHLVRGADLLSSTPRQILLREALGLPPPSHAHIPIMLDERGRKLSKSLAAAPLDPGDPLPALRLAWRALGQIKLTGVTSTGEFWKEASRAWRIERVPTRQSLATADIQPREVLQGDERESLRL